MACTSPASYVTTPAGFLALRRLQVGTVNPVVTGIEESVISNRIPVCGTRFDGNGSKHLAFGGRLALFVIPDGIVEAFGHALFHLN